MGTHFAWIHCTAAQLYMLFALCKSILYSILLSLVDTHCLVQFDIKLDYIYTRLCFTHCAWISSTPVLLYLMSVQLYTDIYSILCTSLCTLVLLTRLCTLQTLAHSCFSKLSVHSYCRASCQPRLRHF